MRSERIERDDGGRRGFTLVEVLVAMLVLAIGVMGALSMQFSALGGAVASQDLTNASDIAQRINHIMKVEAQEWRRGDIGTALAGQSAYDANWNVDSVLLAAASGDQWTQLFAEPVDTRLATSGNQRYCAYVRGDYIQNRRAGGTHRDQSMFRAHIAVVYASGSQSFEGDCPGAGDELISGMDPGKSAEEEGSLERAGYRAVHLGAVVTKRGHLQ